MRVVYVAHSLVAERQARFAQALREELVARSAGSELMEVYPAQWGDLGRDEGYKVRGPPFLSLFRFEDAAWVDVAAFKPDVVMVQQEAYHAAYRIAVNEAKKLHVPVVSFSWENQNLLKRLDAEMLQEAAFNVFGNQDALNLAQRAGVDRPHTILPQVGLDEGLFKPVDGVVPEWDLFFAGRKGDPMKGEHVLDAATAQGAWKVAKGHELGYVSYRELPERYCKAHLLVVPSVDIADKPREQFAPAVTVEAAMCGVPALLSTQAAIREWTRDAPSVWRHEMGSADKLHESIELAFRERDEAPDEWAKTKRDAREWAVAKFSNRVVARGWADVLEQAVS